MPRDPPPSLSPAIYVKMFESSPILFGNNALTQGLRELNEKYFHNASLERILLHICFKQQNYRNKCW